MSILISQKPLYQCINCGSSRRVVQKWGRWVDFTPQGTYGSVWRQFSLSQPGTGDVLLLASSGRRPGMLVNMWQCTGQPHSKVWSSPRCQRRRGWETLLFDNHIQHSGSRCPSPFFSRPEFCLNSYCYYCVLARSALEYFSRSFASPNVEYWSLKMPFMM